MKPITLALVAGAFLAGLALGLSGPIVKAGDGLMHIVVDGSPRHAQADRITVSGNAQQSGFQLTDYRWSAPTERLVKAFCAAKDAPARATPPGLQHL